MARISPLMLFPPLLFAAFAGMAWWGMKENTGSHELPSTRIGQPAPTVSAGQLGSFPQVTQGTLTTGEVTLVNFWATWCPPCRAEHPRLLEMQAEGLRLVGINVKDSESAARGYLDEEGNPFMALGFDPQGRMAIDWGVTGQPETFIISGDGTVLFRFAGPLVGSDYEQRFLPQLQKALGEN